MHYYAMVKKQAKAFLWQNRELLEELEKVNADPDLTDDGRRRRLIPVREKLQAAFEDHLARARAIVEQARADVEENQPIALQRRAAKEPEGRRILAEIRQGHHDDTPQELLAWAKEIQQSAKSDRFAVAHAIRKIVINREDMTHDDRGEIFAALDQVAWSRTRSTLADLVAAQKVFASFELGGPTADPGAAIEKDPARALEMGYAAVRIPGRDRPLGDTEVRELLDSIDVEDKDLVAVRSKSAPDPGPDPANDPVGALEGARAGAA